MMEAEISASKWDRQLEKLDGPTRQALQNVYGSDEDVLTTRVKLLRQVIATFQTRFGDTPLRIFRCPGRINLRGMHVDTHGGYLNLMTHQREVVVAATPAQNHIVTVANIDPQFQETSFDVLQLASAAAFPENWMDFIMAPDVRQRVDARRGDWGNYIEGAWCSVQHRFPKHPLHGINGVVGSDVPRGAALSSSAALCVGMTQAVLGCNGLTLEPDPLILAARDAEWYTGSRCGLSDPAAMVLGGQNELVNIAFYPAAFTSAAARRITFPDALRVLVVNSYTERSLSGAALIDYTRNRFAYSLALEILRQEMRRRSMPEETISNMDRLSNIGPAMLESNGGMPALLKLLADIPETITLAELRTRYDIPDFDTAYNQYFATVPEKLRPNSIRLRGPLLFGIAESERARLFPQALETGDFEKAGRLMTHGHDGDRRIHTDGTPYHYDVSDPVFAAIIPNHESVEGCPGAYGASTSVLDFLVDTALEAGALGASLTGAGMAGAVLALCRADDAHIIAQTLRQRMASPNYAQRRDHPEILTSEELEQAVLTNTATAPASELHLL